jgi:hypothetical protein
VSLIRSIESARKATAPIVGIPLEGEKPFALSRDLLVNSLKGLRIIDAALQLHLETGKPCQLIVYAVGMNGSKVQSVRKFNQIEDCKPYDAGMVAALAPWGTVKGALAGWAMQQREKRVAKLASPKVRVSAKEKQIARWEKQLLKLGKPNPPRHPISDFGMAKVKDRLEHDARELAGWTRYVEEGCDWKRPLTIGQQWARWKREAGVRRWIQLQARLLRANKPETVNTTNQLYRVLRERGVEVKKWSELKTHDKERCGGDLFGYLKILWEFCGLSRKPGYWFDSLGIRMFGPEHYEYWLDHLHQVKELEMMIQAIKEIQFCVKDRDCLQGECEIEMERRLRG